MLKQVFLFLTFFFLAAGSVVAFMRMSKDKKVRKGKAECELLRLIEVGASCFNHYCVGCDVMQLNVLHNVHRRISLG